MQLPDRIYHLAEASNWPSIQREGLLCASRLIAAAGVSRPQRANLDTQQRRTQVELPNAVRIRDQRPMPPAALEQCLCGMRLEQWYALLNSRVFFWLDPARLNRQRAACAARPQVVLAIDTAALVRRYVQQIALTPINTGNARRKPALRGAATFVPFDKWVKSGWASEAAALGTPMRKRSHQPVELTVTDGVPDIMRFMLGVFPLAGGQMFVAPTLG